MKGNNLLAKLWMAFFIPWLAWIYIQLDTPQDWEDRIQHRLQAADQALSHTLNPR